MNRGDVLHNRYRDDKIEAAIRFWNVIRRGRVNSRVQPLSFRHRRLEGINVEAEQRAVSDAFEEEALSDAQVRALMARVRLAPEPRFDALFPTQRCASARIALTDGRVLDHEQTTRKGDPDAPLSDEELSGKYFELTTPVIGRAAAESVMKTLWALDRLDTVDFLSRR